MQHKHNPDLVPFARELRKNMTQEERRLWYNFLRNHPYKFLRQKILGRYIVDFYCAQAKIAIELDGSQHFDTFAMKKDEERTAFLNQYGIRVVRIPNCDVNQNFSGVCEYIDAVVRQSLEKLQQ